MKIKKQSWEVIVPPGKYYLGDPCYVMPSKHYDYALDVSGCFMTSPIAGVSALEDDEDGHLRHINYYVLSFGTAFGDWVYPGSDGYSYSVDSGMIGLVPLEYVDKDKLGQSIEKYGTVVEFTEETECRNYGGNMWFGNININTWMMPENEENEHDEPREWDEEDDEDDDS